MTSRREDVVADWPVIVTVALIARMTVPAVGYGRGDAVVALGITIPRSVSPVPRFALNAPCDDVPVGASAPAEAPFPERCALPLARPVTVCVLDSLTTLLLLSRRVAVRLTVTVVATAFVVLSMACCPVPAVVV